MVSFASLRSNAKAWGKKVKSQYKMKKYELIYNFKKKCNIHCGSTRAVVVTKRYAFKFPRLKDFDSFFKGLAANEKERTLSKEAPDYFVPVLFAIPGLLTAMPACKPFGEDSPMVRAFFADLFHPDNDERSNNGQVYVARRMCEYINENYAMYKGKPMCIDYGTYLRAENNEKDFEDALFWMRVKLKEKLGIHDEPVEEVVQSEQKPYQVCLELLDIPVFTANVENKGSTLAPRLDDVQTCVEGQVSGGTTGNRRKGHHGLGDDTFATRGIQIKGHPLRTQKETFTPALSTIYPGNAALR